MADPRMVFLGFGKSARSDRIYAVEPLPGDERGSGARTRVWVEGISEPVIASRSERAILADMGVLRRSLWRRLSVDTRPLRHRDFRNLWIGQAISTLGGEIGVVAVPYQVY